MVDEDRRLWHEHDVVAEGLSFVARIETSADLNFSAFIGLAARRA